MMFAKLAGLTIAALVAGVSAAPAFVVQPFTTLNSWGAFESMRDFDHFYGPENFSGHLREVHAIHEPELVCHAQQVTVIQERLLVLKEFAKKIITETICEVETQIFVFEQWHRSLGHFSDDLRRVSGRPVGFDRAIAGHFGRLVQDDWVHLGFSGHDLGKQYAIPAGHNWDDSRSRSSVGSAWFTAHELF